MNQAPTMTSLNGIDTEALEQTVKAIQNDPSLAECKFRVKNQWLEGGHNRTEIKEFYAAGREDTARTEPFKIEADEPPALLGEDRAPNPVEHLLSALSACMTSSIIYHAAANGVPIDELKSEFEGDLDLHGFLGLSTQVRPGYQNIRAVFHVKSEATKEQLESFTKFSPVFDVVSHSVPVSVRIEKI